MRAKKERSPDKPLSLPKKILVYGGFVLFGLLLIIMFVSGAGPYDIPPTARTLDDVIEVSRSLGLPLTEAEVERPVPDEENAALIVLPVARRLQREVPVSFTSWSPSEVPTTETLELIQSAVDRASKSLNEIQAAVAERDGWFVENDLELGPNLMYPEFLQVRHAADLFRFRAYLLAKDGQVEHALQDLGSSRKLGRLVAANSCLMGFLSSAGIELKTLTMAVQFAFVWRGDAEALERLGQWERASLIRLDVRPAIRQEFFMGVAVARNLSHYGGIRVVFDPVMSHGEEFVFDEEGLQRTGLPGGMWERAFLARFARVYNAGYAPIKDEPHPSFGWSKAFNDEYDGLDYSNGLSAGFAQMVVPRYQGLDERMAQVDALQSIALATIDTHLFRLRNGRLPDDLQELGSQYTDPFTSKSLLYRQTPDGFRIWSVDKDGKDDGGVTRDDPHGATVDIVAIVPPLLDKPFKP